MSRYNITARVLYNKIVNGLVKPNGLYVFLTPDDEALVNLSQLLATCPVKTLNVTDLHCTALHCKTDKLPSMQDSDLPADVPRVARIAEVIQWKDHKDRNIWVLGLDSHDVQTMHTQLTGGLGFKHSYPEFNPHITIAKDVPNSAEARLWFDQVNELLKEYPVNIRFDLSVKAGPLE